MSLFVTFEGPEGSGKTTQIQLLAKALLDQGYDVIATREPGGTRIGNAVRSLVLDPDYGEMSPRAESLLYNASRAQHVHQIITPALNRGAILLCDRYGDSTLAYQGYGRGQDLAALRSLIDFATGGLKPHLTIYLDLDVREGLQRKSAAEWNRIEAQTVAFHERVQNGYHTLASEEPQRWLVVDATQSIDAIHRVILARVQHELRQRDVRPVEESPERGTSRGRTA
jgi:dTMP kinase